MTTHSQSQNRWATLLSIDLVGFSAITNDLGSELAADFLENFQMLAADCVEQNGGQVVDRAGDGLLAAFGASRPLERAALEGSRAALALRAKLAAEADSFEDRFKSRPEVRIGIAVGQTTISQNGDTIKVVGPAVNEAARLQESALPGEIILSGAAREEAGSNLETSQPKGVKLKGFDEPVAAFSLNGLRSASHSFAHSVRQSRSLFVGRKSEFHAALSAIHGREGSQSVLVSGPAGIGKTRLAREVTTTLTDGDAVLVAQCSETTGKVPYAPVLEILRQADVLGLAETLVGEDRHYDDQVGDLQNRALEFRERLLQSLTSLSKDAGCLIVIEDLHWADSGTLDVMKILVRRGARLLLTFRPGYPSDRLNGQGTQNLSLQELGDASVDEIISAAFDSPVSPRLSESIRTRSEGNPLLAEELCRALRTSGNLRASALGLDIGDDVEPLLTGKIGQLVMSHVDRLAPEVQYTLRYASAMGREFSSELLQRAAGSAADLEMIASESDLVERATSGRWSFRHALFGEAIYQSLHSKNRRFIHADIAEALGGVVGAEGEQAQQYELAEDLTNAVPRLVAQNGRLLAAYALQDVDETSERILGYIEKVPELLSSEEYNSFVVTWLRALDQIGNFGRINAIYDRLLPRLEADGYSRSLSIANTLAAIALSHSRDYQRGLRIALEARAQAEKHGDDHAAAWAKVALLRIWDETFGQDRNAMVSLAKEIEPVAEAAEDTHLALSGRYLLSSTYRTAGQRVKALEVAKEIEVYAERSGDRRAFVYGRWARALVYSIEGSFDMAASTIEGLPDQAIPRSGDHSVCLMIELFTRAMKEPDDATRAEIDAFIAERRDYQDYNIYQSLDWTKAVMRLRSGQLALGWRELNAMRPFAAKAGNKNFVRQIHIARAEVFLSLLGLIDSGDERSPDRRKSPGLADIWYALRLRIVAKRAARRDLEKCLELDPLQNGVNYARAQIGLGLLAMRNRDLKSARRHLEVGLEHAKAEELTLLINRAEGALARL